MGLNQKVKNNVIGRFPGFPNFLKSYEIVLLA
jgi:hypothetical protein